VARGGHWQAALVRVDEPAILLAVNGDLRGATRRLSCATEPEG
jgi:hypothetical protein